MTQIILYTASFGNHDKPQEIYGLPEGVLPICFTDDASLTRKTWQVILRPRVFGHPRMDAKWYKMSACHLFPDAPRSLYIDSSIWVWDAGGFIKKCLGAMSDPAHGGSGIALFAHPEGQSSLWGEAQHSLSMPKYAGDPLYEQVQHYESAGFVKDDSRIFAGGVIVREHDEIIERLEKAWLDECIHWSVQDQISLPYVLWRASIKASVIPGDIYHDDHHLYLWSGPA